MLRFWLKPLLFLSCMFMTACLSDLKDSDQNESVQAWITMPDKSMLLNKQDLSFSGTAPAGIPEIRLETETHFQPVEGFGFTLTGGSARLIRALSSQARKNLLMELFGKGEGQLNIRFLRLSLGASDLSDSPFTYNDLGAGQTDLTLQRFSLSLDTLHVIPLLKEILAIQPEIRLMASPWSAPAWMKTNGSLVGGSLQPNYYAVYARYFARYLSEMSAQGIPMYAVTVQNEPLHGGNNPSMVMTAEEQRVFVRDHLGPVFAEQQISTRIIVWDHNCDRPDYPLTILNDANAKKYVHGSAFHLYAGSIDALSEVHRQHPDKALYFTEQWTDGFGTFAGDLGWHMENVVIGSMRNWSRTALAWNLASDPSFDPHTDGGCDRCMGGITISTDGQIQRNVAYYVIGHASSQIPEGSIRIESNVVEGLPNAAFLLPDGRLTLLAVNRGSRLLRASVNDGKRYFTLSLPAGAAATYTWKP